MAELFFENMGTAALQVVVLFINVAVGLVSNKLKFYTEKTAKATTKLLFYVITPTVIVRSFLTMEYSKEKLGGFLIALACAIGTHICGIILSIPFFNKFDTRTGTVYKFASIFGNMGYMGLPLAQSVVGPMGVFYCSAGVVAYNILVFT